MSSIVEHLHPEETPDPTQEPISHRVILGELKKPSAHTSSAKLNPSTSATPACSFQHIVVLDFDGVLNMLGYKEITDVYLSKQDVIHLPQLDISLEDVSIFKAVLALLEKNNILTVMGSARLASPKCTPVTAQELRQPRREGTLICHSNKDTMYCALNIAFGIHRSFLTEPHADQLHHSICQHLKEFGEFERNPEKYCTVDEGGQYKLTEEGISFLRSEMTSGSKLSILDAVMSTLNAEHPSKITLVDDSEMYRESTVEAQYGFILADDKKEYLAELLCTLIPKEKLEKDLDELADEEVKTVLRYHLETKKNYFQRGMNHFMYEAAKGELNYVGKAFVALAMTSKVTQAEKIFTFEEQSTLDRMIRGMDDHCLLITLNIVHRLSQFNDSENEPCEPQHISVINIINDYRDSSGKPLDAEKIQVYFEKIQAFFSCAGSTNTDIKKLLAAEGLLLTALLGKKIDFSKHTQKLEKLVLNESSMKKIRSYCSLFGIDFNETIEGLRTRIRLLKDTSLSTHKESNEETPFDSREKDQTQLDRKPFEHTMFSGLKRSRSMTDHLDEYEEGEKRQSLPRPR